ncbi:SprT family protein [Enterococcus mundtii]|uniref:SprT family protein n=1 Tax=Enterococcus mundtii TaxID=53346 RepID=UPI000CF17480|nr:SprT family protein [Enterococcus mundtii]PQC28501.1 SprT family protein [Enterococcus mundtii]
MTQEELQQLVEEISLTSFQRPFMHQAMFNKRLKTTGGRYHLNDHHLDFNPTMFAVADQATIIGIIKHELCHYHLHLTGKGYRHRDSDFKQLLVKTGGLRYAPAIPSNRRQKIEGYQCQKCAEWIYRKRKINTDHYLCGRCRGRLVWQKTTYLDVE